MAQYPALYDHGTKALHSLSVHPFVVGRSENANVPVLDVTCSRQHFRILRSADGYSVEALSETNPTFCNGNSVQTSQRLQHNDVIQAGNCRFRFLEHAPTQERRPATAEEPKAPPPPEEPRETVYADKTQPVEGVQLAQSIALQGKMLIGRDAARAQICLPHPQVSRVHAHLALRDDGQAILSDLNSANGTFLNGQRLQGPRTMRPGDCIDIGPYVLLFDGSRLVPRSRSNNIELTARRLTRAVPNRETGRPLVLLDAISLVIRPREFVCILGPSGSGKSTLLGALSGRVPADQGSVLINNQELYAHFEALKQEMAVVPQKDVLHDSLTVGQALWYTAKLRLPPDTSKAEAHECIEQILDTVNLTPRRGTSIRHLSGGQVKRASLANEILCKPTLLFLDEVTSGLDEQTDREMMNLFRSLAESGKTVVCITHSLANVERTCHLVVVLTQGGKLAFVGQPAEALTYFKIERLGDVYERLAEQPAETWQAQFAAHPLHTRYVKERLPVEGGAPAVPVVVRQRGLGEQARQLSRQTTLLASRYWAIWRADWMALGAMLAQSVLVAVLLGILFGNLSELTDAVDQARRTLSLFFFVGVASFWFGCNNAAKELVKERLLFQRERDYNLQVGSYYASKLLLLVFFSVVQTLVLFLITKVWCAPPGAFLGPWLVLAALAVAGVALGLAISAGSPTEEMAVTLIPIAVLPQIILSGAIAPLSGVSKLLAQMLITTYWGKQALDALLPEKTAQAVALTQGSAVAAVAMVLLHALVFFLAAMVFLFLQTRRGSLVRR